MIKDVLGHLAIRTRCLGEYNDAVTGHHILKQGRHTWRDAILHETKWITLPIRASVQFLLQHSDQKKNV